MAGTAHSKEQYIRERDMRLRQSFVLCSHLMSVEDADAETDREGFHALPDIGIGVIGQYRALRDMENATPNIIVRESVYKKLCAADQAMKKKPEYQTCQIVVTYGYRSPEIQTALWKQLYEEIKTTYPEESEDEIREIAHTKIAYPEVAGHPTGGAVDVVIYDFEKEEFLDFGTEVGDLTTTSVYYKSDAISETARRHRTDLREFMCKQGFAPYDGEWWHFSYGDREWAYYYKRRAKRQHRNEGLSSGESIKALYKQKDFSEISEIAHSEKYRLNKETKEELRIRLAVQKDGRLTEETLSILKRSGIEVTRGKRGFLARAGNFPLDVLFVRDDDIPNLVEAGVADLGIVGENVYWENRSAGAPSSGVVGENSSWARKSKSIIERELGFGKCFLGLAVPRSSGIKTLKDLVGKRIATSHHNLTEQFLEVHGLKDQVEIIDIAGSVEVAPLINYADAIIDLVSTGSSLKQNNLVLLNNIHILDSQSILISNRVASDNQEKRKIMDCLLERIDSYLLAKQYKRVIMNAPTISRAKVCDILAGLADVSNFGDDDSWNDELRAMQDCENPLAIGIPVVLPSYGFEKWDTIQVIMKLSDLWRITPELKKLRVCNILFYDIEGLINFG